MREDQPDDGPAYDSRACADFTGEAGFAALPTRPYRPRPMGKLTRSWRALRNEWARR